jgi:asparagine synthetase B (glutamine-hydrolysing)
LHEQWQHILSLPSTPASRSSERFVEQFNIGGLPEISAAEHCSRLAGVEVGIPYADRELTALSARLPLVARINKGITRYVHREAMRGIVPDSIRSRTTKAAFGGFFHRVWEDWIRDDYTSMTLIQDWVDPRRLPPKNLKLGSNGWLARQADVAVIFEWLRAHCQ